MTAPSSPSPAATEHAPLVWLDLEMTGLDPDRDTILEIATLVTDDQLDVIAEGPDLVVFQPDEVLAAMGPWCRSHHAQSGLTAAVRGSDCSLADAEQATLEFLGRHTLAGRSPLCGNSIGQDRRFLARHMPRLEAYLHYRNVDVSSIKELVKRWYPAAPPIEKAQTHRALDDIVESIAELRQYRQTVFR
ncbi:MAG: oligoribonuclease [Myxococcales bacterium FL481]|nr:MAG: oligoribonuclease [Myxococcales bacterium FL481]